MQTGMKDIMMGMGMWLLWGALGIVAIMAFVKTIKWMRREKQNSTTVAAAAATTTVAAATAPATRSIDESAIKATSDNEPDILDAIFEDDDEDDIMADTANTAAGSNGHHGEGSNPQYIRGNSWGFWPWALISALVLGVLGWLVWNSSMASDMGVFKWILWSLLGLAGLFTVLGIGQMSRRHPMVDEKRGSPRGMGFITLISGLVLGLASWFVWQPKIAGFAGLQEQVNNFEKREIEFNETSKGLASKLISRNTLIKRLTADADKSTAKIAGLEKNLDDDKATYDSETTRLNGVITSLTAERSDMSAENTRLKGLIGQSKSDDGEVARLNNVIVDLNKTNATMSGENTRLKGLLNANTGNAGKTSGLAEDNSDLKVKLKNSTAENTRMKGIIGTYQNDNQVQTAKIASLDAELAKLRARPPVTRSLSPGKSRGTPLGMIHGVREDKTKLGLTSSNYNIVKADQQNMVAGRKGRFYFIDLVNPANGGAYKFAPASYSRVREQASFKKSLDHAIADVKAAFDGKRAYQLYVRGKASAGRYAGNMAKGYEYNDIKVLPRNSDDSWGADPVDRQYSKVIRNKDLPNMRGAYLQEFISKNYEIAKPIILDGDVSRSKNASKQAVSVILFVED